jgi:hypothetical protein
MSASDIVYGIEILVKTVRMQALDIQTSIPQILVLTPPPIGQLHPDDILPWAGAQDKCKQVGQYLKISQNRNKFQLLDTHTIMTAEELDIDGYHLPEDCHRKLGEAVATKLQQMNK